MSHVKRAFEIVALTLAAFFTVGHESMASESELPQGASQIYEELKTESDKEHPAEFNQWVHDNQEKAIEMIKKYHSIQEFHELLPYDVKEELERYVKSLEGSESEDKELGYDLKSIHSQAAAK